MSLPTAAREPGFRRLLALTLIILVLSGFSLEDRAVAAQPVGEPVKVRIGVTSDGIVVITPADLAGLGINVASIDPRKFALASLGRSVSIDVTGESDGSFDDADRLYFFGQRYRSNTQDEKYTDERVYWLTIDGAPGPRISTAGAQPYAPLPGPADFPTTLRAEENHVWWPLHTLELDTQDTWFWARLVPLAPESPETASMPFFVPYPAQDKPATVSAEFISRSGRGGTTPPDHRTALSLNGQPVFDESWDGPHVRKVFSGAVPAGVVSHGPNTAVATAWAVHVDGTADVDDVYVNYWEIRYRRLFRAYEGVLDFVAEYPSTQYLVDGWSSQDVLIWNVSDADNPVQLSTAVPAFPFHTFLPLIARSAPGSLSAVAAESVSVRFQAKGPAGTRYWMQERVAVKPPASIGLRPPTGLRESLQSADAVIVTDEELLPAAQLLAGWHSSQGRNPVVAGILDVYDEFDDGLHHPRAIQKMMAYVYAARGQSGPIYLTLVGDGHWNFKGYQSEVFPTVPTIHIPPYLSWVDSEEGEVPTDNRFGDIDDDGRPEVAVGRLAVNSLAEANAVVNKIISYDQSVRAATWQKNALFVADNPDWTVANFPAQADEIINGYTPADLTAVKAYLPVDARTRDDVSTTLTRNLISSTIQSGVWMIQYNGHGSVERWTHESLWLPQDIAALTNGDMLPFVMTFNCLDGYFAAPGVTSMAEAWQRQPGGGAIAVVSPTGLGFPTEQQEFRKLLLTTMFNDNVPELGRALLLAKQDFYAAKGRHYLIETTTLFGDPALRLPVRAN